MTALLTPPTRPVRVVHTKKVRSRNVTIEKFATPLSEPHMVTVFNPVLLKDVEHYGYEARVQHRNKEDEVRVVLCSRLDTVKIGEPVMLVYHTGMQAYKHNRHMFVSNSDNCSGGFYYMDGAMA
jgi:hypothetical protein